MKLTEQEWGQAKALYITGQMSYRELAEQFGVGLSTIHKRGKAEGWGTERKELIEETTTQTAVLFAADASQRIRRLGDVFDRFVAVLDKVSMDLEEKANEGAIPRSMELKGYIESLRLLKDIGSVKTQAELQEFNAKMRMLEKQSAQNENSGSNIVVSFEGVDECQM